jgi:bleomycin hydrolase
MPQPKNLALPKIILPVYSIIQNKKMKQIFLLLTAVGLTVFSFAQDDILSASKGNNSKPEFTVLKKIQATPVKNQSATGTCWSFSTTSLIESQSIKNNLGEFDLSEMFTVRNMYMEKARNYILRQGRAQFGEGGLGHDQIRAIANYGAMPESVYSGLLPGQKLHNHQKLSNDLKQYLDSLLKHIPLAQNWMAGFTKILDDALGKPPEKFDYRGKNYTPQSFAKEALQFNANDYVFITSFTHHPFYAPFVIEVPDNFSNGSYINIPVGEMIQLTKDALLNGYTVMWDADVSNVDFKQNNGMAVLYDTSINALKKMNVRKLKAEGQLRQKDQVIATDSKTDMLAAAENANSKGEKKPNTDVTREEVIWDAELRQTLFENLTTQDDHLMHITGLEKTKTGNNFFMVKNSWGNVGPDNGYIHVSESYFAINTISLVVPKAALSKAMLDKLKIK